MIGAFAPVVSIAAAALSFGVADTLGGSGFLAVYLVGLAVGSTPSRYRQQLAAFHEGVAFVAQVGLFVLLGLLVFPHELPHVALPGVALAVAVMLVARPAAVWVSTALSRYSTRDRVLLGWAGLRGAAPIVVATFVLESQVRHSESIFNIVFFVVVVSALVQGTTLERVAHQLGLTSSAPPVPTRKPEAGPLSRARPRRVPGHIEPRDQRLGRPRTGLAARHPRCGHPTRRPGDPTARQHDRASRRPALRPRPPSAPPRARGRLCSLAPPDLRR